MTCLPIDRGGLLVALIRHHPASLSAKDLQLHDACTRVLVVFASRSSVLVAHLAPYKSPHLNLPPGDSAPPVHGTPDPAAEASSRW